MQWQCSGGGGGWLMLSRLGSSSDLALAKEPMSHFTTTNLISPLSSPMLHQRSSGLRFMFHCSKQLVIVYQFAKDLLQRQKCTLPCFAAPICAITAGSKVEPTRDDRTRKLKQISQPTTTVQPTAPIQKNTSNTKKSAKLRKWQERIWIPGVVGMSRTSA